MADVSKVTNGSELAQALASGISEIEIDGTITGSPMITVPPGVTLRGGVLRLGAKGVRLTSDNTLDRVTVLTEDDEVAILNDTSVTDLGTLTLRDVHTTGQVLLVADGQVRRGHIHIDGLHVERADVRGRARRPHGFGVEALPGALTVWNLQADPAVTITAELLDIAAGSRQTPVRGSGVFVGGHGDWNGKGDGGVLRVSHLRTGEIHADGGIPEATPDLISGGVFVISGAVVEQVTNVGPVTTYGQNDMVLDNWGDVNLWTATAPVTSEGPSGIGFVNFATSSGSTCRLRSRPMARAPAASTCTTARCASIATTGDGSVGIQISKPLGSLEVTGDVTTSGGEGLSLVKGVQVVLKAVALSIKPGGDVGSIRIGGKVLTSGDEVNTVEIEGKLDRLDVTGGIIASGNSSDAVHTCSGVPGLDGIPIEAADGQAVVRI